MLIIALAASMVLAVFLLGMLVIAVALTTRHADSTACYPLYAVRDELINSVVFEGVSRDDPWLDTLYENVNRVLVQASNPGTGNELKPLPADPDRCPVAIRSLSLQLRDALQHLVHHHRCIHLQMDAHQRRQRRLQREKAQDLLAMMNGSSRSRLPLAAR